MLDKVRTVECHYPSVNYLNSQFIRTSHEGALSIFF